MSSARLIFMLLIVGLPASSGCNRPSTVTAQPVEQGQQREPSLETPPAARPIVDSTFDDIKFEMEKTDAFRRSMLTPQVEELLGRQIRIRGYMFPTLKKRGLKQFVLVRDNLECCFGPGAALFDCILVHMNEGKTAEYSIRPVAVEGTLRLEEIIGPDQRHLAIYRLDGDEVE